MGFLLIVFYFVGTGQLPVEAAIIGMVVLEAWWVAVLVGLFRKARIPFGLAFVPVARFWFFTKIATGNGMSVVMWLIPVYNICWLVRFDRLLAARFGMSKFFGTCMLLCHTVFYMWLAFSPGATCQPVDMRTGRLRDARGYSGGGFVEGLYDAGTDPAKAEKKRSDMAELRRKYDERHR